jgi:hypothetical protein
MTSEAHRLSSRLARWNALAFGVTFGLLIGVGVFGATVILVLTTGPDPGRHLGLLAQYLPGYTVSVGGALVGFCTASLVAGAVAVPAAWVYYVGVLRKIERARGGRVEGDLACAESRIDVPTFCLAAGLFCGLGLFLATALLLLKHVPGTPLGPTLGLLGRYLPGYEVSLRGSLVGFAYFAAIGAAVFAVVGQLYNFLLVRLPRSRKPTGI